MEFFNEKSTIYQMAVELKNKFDDEVNIMVNGQLPMLIFDEKQVWQSHYCKLCMIMKSEHCYYYY